jgi:enterobactin synthetase component D
MNKFLEDLRVVKINNFITLVEAKYNIDSYDRKLFSYFDINESEISNFSKKREAEYLASRFCIKKALENLNIHNYIVKKNKDRSLNWLDKVNGSITHTHNSTSVLVTKLTHINLGIDEEYIMSKKTYNEIKSIVFNSNEQNIIQEQEKTATILFSAKETFYKAIYRDVKIFIDFNEVEIISINDNKLKLKLLTNLSNKHFENKIYEIDYNIKKNKITTMFLGS